MTSLINRHDDSIMAWSSSATMFICSASSTKQVGAIGPWVALVHRASASTDVIVPVRRSMTGWNTA